MPFQVSKEISLNDIQLSISSSPNPVSNQLSSPNQISKRISLSSTIINEMITTIRYCLFNNKEEEQFKIAYEAMHAIYLRALFYQMEDILLYSQSVLKVLKNG